MKSLVAIVIPNWNGKDLLADCLKSLQAQSTPGTIIVVDNGSQDQSVAMVKAKFPGVELVELDINHGFAGGVNAGIKKAMDLGMEYVALFNNDAAADKNWLKELLASSQQNKNIGIVTGKLLRLDGKHLDSTGDFYTIWGLPFPRGRNEVDNGQYDQPGEVFAASGGASLYKVKLLEDIGLFDEDFFAYFEDDDISFRGRLVGWKIIYNPKALAYHHVNATSSKLGSFSRYHSIKNFIILYNKDMPLRLWFKYLPLYLTQLARMFVGSLRDHQSGAFIKGLGAAVWQTPKTLNKRWAIQKSSKLSARQVDDLLVHSRPPKVAKL